MNDSNYIVRDHAMQAKRGEFQGLAVQSRRNRSASIRDIRLNGWRNRSNVSILSRPTFCPTELFVMSAFLPASYRKPLSQLMSRLRQKYGIHSYDRYSQKVHSAGERDCTQMKLF